MVSMVKVSSSAIDAIGFNKDDEVLYVTFSSGVRYRYFRVPSKIYEGLLKSASVGKFFDEHIRKADYRYEEVR